MTPPDHPLDNKPQESCDVQDIAAMERSLAGVKRDISDMDDTEEDASPTKKMKASADPDGIHDTTTTMNLEYSSEVPDSTIAALKASLTNANEELERWKYAFINHSILSSGAVPDPTVVVQAIQKLQVSEVQLQEELLTAKRREEEILVKLAKAEHEISNLKSTVRSLKRMSKRSLPSMVRPLLPKPSNFDEFLRLKKELEPAEKIATEVPDITAAVQIRPRSMHASALNENCPENSGAGCESSGGKDEDGRHLICVPPQILKKKVGRPRKHLVAKEEDEGEESKKNWMDSEVETLISFRWEMEPDFVKNAYKQGVDMWAQLQARMVAAIPGFTRSGLACQRKFNSLMKQHKKDVLEVKQGKHHTWDRHARKFNDSLDRWWHTNGTVMKHVSTNANNANHSDSEAAHLSGNKEDSIRANVKEDEEGEETKKNWLDSEVETLVSQRWEMEPEFVENAYKPGEDMWSKLQSRMTSLLPGFTRSGLACQRKFNALIKQHKKDVQELKESGRDQHNYKFFDILDRWWHTNGTVMKHVTASPDESESLNNPTDSYLEDSTNTFIGEDDDEGDEGKKNWTDSEVETLIALRREMEPEFVKNWKKQGGNMWSKLRSRMLLLYPGFSRSPIACKRKFNTLVRQYKKEVHAMDGSGDEPHSCKHQGLLDQWLHANGTSLRPNTASGSDHELTAHGSMAPNEAQQDVSTPHNAEGSLVPYEDKELENGDSIFGSLTKMVQNSHDVVDEIAKPGLLSGKMDGEMDPLIDNLKYTVSK